MNINLMILARSLLRTTSGLARPLPRLLLLQQTPSYGMAFMQLFERNKTPAELSPVFRRETKEKGHIRSQARKVHSPKLNTKARKQKQRLKNHKGLLKRIKIVLLIE
jgi:hypothetical protein